MATPPEAQIFVFEGFQLDVARRKLTGPDGIVEVPSRAFEVLLYMVAHAGDLLEKATIAQSGLAEHGRRGRQPQPVHLCVAAGARRHRERSLASSPPSRDAAISSWRRCASRFRQMRRLTLRGPAPGGRSMRAPPWRWPSRCLSHSGSGPQRTPDNAIHMSAQRTLAPASIAVMPFADLSPAKDMEYFADGHHRRTHE